MRTRIVHLIAGLVFSASATAVFAGAAVNDPHSCSAQPQTVGARWQRAAAIENGALIDAAGRVAIDVVELDPCGEVVVGAGLLRHLAAGEQGIAVVNDVAGPDQLLALGEAGLEVLDTHGEVTHPAWSSDGSLAWAEDFETIRVASSDRSTITTLVPPRGTLGAFAPYFSGADDIVAVVKENSPATTAEDDGLNNLWRFDLAAHEWSPITHFRPLRARWTALRTPVVAPDGAVYFVRVTANPNATREPRFELWRARGANAEKVRVLPQEMFLAGMRGDDLVWNVLSRPCGGWGLAVEVGGGLDPIGCGRVAVDPHEIDPDAALGHDEHGEGDDHDEDEAAAKGSRVRLGIVVGDFRTRFAAGRVAGRLPAELAGRVIGHDEARDLVRPRAWAVVVSLPSDAVPEQALQEVRGSLGGCRCDAWLAPLPR